MNVRLLVLVSAVLLAAAPAAHAQGVTNPAENPAPITITIDGQTYHDGRDTLPGYDDDLCTAIPNVQYDFDNDQIQYYDGGGELIDTAHWTEWSRISSYDTWVKQHAGTPSATPTPAATSTPAPTSAAVATPAPTSAAGKSPSSAAKSPSSRSGRSRSTTHTRTPPRSAAGSDAPTTQGTPSHRATHARSAPAKHEEASSSRASTGAAATDPAGGGGGSGTTPPPVSNAPVAGVSATPSGGGSVPAAKTKFKLASQTLGGPRDTRLAGAGILVALFALGCLGLVFGEFRHHVFGRPIR